MTFTAINFPLSAAFTASHIFCYIVFLFSLNTLIIRVFFPRAGPGLPWKEGQEQSPEAPWPAALSLLMYPQGLWGERWARRSHRGSTADQPPTLEQSLYSETQVPNLQMEDFRSTSKLF